jgi:hypothetical protein
MGGGMKVSCLDPWVVSWEADSTQIVSHFLRQYSTLGDAGLMSVDTGASDGSSEARCRTPSSCIDTCCRVLTPCTGLASAAWENAELKGLGQTTGPGDRLTMRHLRDAFQQAWTRRAAG